jgi:hypothetical protein
MRRDSSVGAKLLAHDRVRLRQEQKPTSRLVTGGSGNSRVTLGSPLPPLTPVNARLMIGVTATKGPFWCFPSHRRQTHDVEHMCLERT